MNKHQKIIVTTAYIECCMCPTIYVGKTSDGCTVYARYRWGHLSVRFDPRDPAPHSGAAGRWIYEQQLDPKGLAGSLSYEELREMTTEIIEWPEHLSPPKYEDGEAKWLDNL